MFRENRIRNNHILENLLSHGINDPDLAREIGHCDQFKATPANTRCLADAGAMLGQRRMTLARHCASIGRGGCSAADVTSGEVDGLWEWRKTAAIDPARHPGSG